MLLLFLFFCEQKGNNIILMGSPGAGKTTVGRILGHHLGKEVIDVDDDVLEKVWGISVAEKVQPSEKQSYVHLETVCCILLVIATMM